MSKKSSAPERLWHGSVLVLGSTVALSVALQLLTGIWGWLLLGAAAIGLIAVARAALRHRQSNW